MRAIFWVELEVTSQYSGGRLRDNIAETVGDALDTLDNLDYVKVLNYDEITIEDEQN